MAKKSGESVIMRRTLPSKVSLPSRAVGFSIQKAVSALLVFEGSIYDAQNRSVSDSVCPFTGNLQPQSQDSELFPRKQGQTHDVARLSRRGNVSLHWCLRSRGLFYGSEFRKQSRTQRK